MYCVVHIRYNVLCSLWLVGNIVTNVINMLVVHRTNAGDSKVTRLRTKISFNVGSSQTLGALVELLM